MAKKIVFLISDKLKTLLDNDKRKNKISLEKGKELLQEENKPHCRIFKMDDYRIKSNTIFKKNYRDLFVLYHFYKLKPDDLKWIYTEQDKSLLSHMKGPTDFTGELWESNSPEEEKTLWYTLNKKPHLLWAEVSPKDKNFISFHYLLTYVFQKLVNGTTTLQNQVGDFKYLYLNNKVNYTIGARNFSFFKFENWDEEKVHDSLNALKVGRVRDGLFDEKEKRCIIPGVGQGKNVFLKHTNLVYSGTPKNKSFVWKPGDAKIRIHNELFFTDTNLEGNFNSITLKDANSKEEIYNFNPTQKEEIVKFIRRDGSINMFSESGIEGTETAKRMFKIAKENFERAGSTLTADIAGFSLGSIKKMAGAALGVKTSTEEQLKQEIQEGKTNLGDKISQCILISSMAEIAKKSVEKRKEIYKLNTDGWKALGHEHKAPYGGRIYCIDSETSNSDLNTTTLASGINHFVDFFSMTDLEKFKYDVRLFKVEEKDGDEKDFELFFGVYEGAKTTTKAFNLVSTTDEQLTKAERKKILKGAANPGDKPAGTYQATNQHEYIALTNAKIDLKGTTMADIKSNIDVTLTFSLPSIDAMGMVFEVKGGQEYEYSLLDVLNHHGGRKYTGTQASKLLKSAYIPIKNRIVLQVFRRNADLGPMKKILNQDDDVSKDYRGQITKYLEDSVLSLDLSMYNYDLEIDSGINKSAVTITVNYKGFIKSFISDPYCDVINERKTILKLLEEEKKTIKELDTQEKYCDLKEVKERLTKHFTDMSEIKNNAKQTTGVIQKLIDRNRMYKIDFNLSAAIQDNIDSKTKKIINPMKIANAIKKEKEISLLENDGNITSEKEDILDGDIIFFYFGDLVDALMDFMYDEPTVVDERPIDTLWTTTNNGETNPQQVPKADDGDNVSAVQEKFANFSLKCILPSFNPVELVDNNDDTYSAKISNEKISIADIPVSFNFFKRWYNDHIVKKGVTTYSFGAIIINLLNALVNNTLADNCYRLQTIERKYYAVRSDYGLFNRIGDNNLNWKYQNKTSFDKMGIEQNYQGKGNGMIRIKPKDAPLIRKNITTKRKEQCNFIQVYELANSFKSFKDLEDNQKKGITNKSLKNNNIPKFIKKTLNKKYGKEKKTTGFTSSMSFSKTEIAYAEEMRFASQGLNELSSLSRVHNCQLDTLPLFGIWPGAIIWIDAGFLDRSYDYGSIPWITGIGGFHVVNSVSHDIPISKGQSKLKSKTSIDAKFVSSGVSNIITSEYTRKCKASAKQAAKKLADPKNEGDETE